MKVPDLVGLRLEEGLKALENSVGLLNVSINKAALPDDFFKKGIQFGVQRIVRQKNTSGDGIELVVFTFNETPILPLWGE